MATTKLASLSLAQLLEFRDSNERGLGSDISPGPEGQFAISGDQQEAASRKGLAGRRNREA